MCFCLPLSAQQSRPDTVHWGDSCYFFPNYYINDFSCPHINDTLDNIFFYSYSRPGDVDVNLNGIVATIHPLHPFEMRFYGIAVAMSRSHCPAIPNSVDSLYETPHVYLFQCHNGRWHTVDSVGLSNNIPIRHLSAPTQMNNTRVIVPTIDVYEFFFSEPRWILDTFAIGYGRMKALHRDIWEKYWIVGTCQPIPFGYYSTYEMYRNRRIAPLFEEEGTIPALFPLLIPILEPPPEDYVFLATPDDTTPAIPYCMDCYSSPYNFRIAWREENEVTLQWNEANDVPAEWEIRIDPVSRPDQAPRYYRTPYMMKQIAGIDSGQYVARIRGVCRHSCELHTDTTSFGSWSNSYVQFSVTNPLPRLDDPTLSASSAAELPQVNVAPNPAKAFVDISADCTVQQVVLRDATGKAVLRQSCDETSVRISLASIPAGLYVVEISTARGTVSRKLVVE